MQMHSLPRQLTKASLGAKLIESVYGVSYRIRGF